MKNLFKYSSWLPIIAAIGLLLTGCSTASDVVIFNNANSAIEVTCRGQNIIVERNSSCQVSYDSIAEGFTIRIDTNSSTYKIPVMNARKASKLSKHKTWMDILTVQLNSDGAIYVVAPDTKLPTSQYPEQPDNFPLKPSK